MDPWRNLSISVFCGDVLLPLVEAFKSDVFVTYDHLKRLPVGEFALVFTRKRGCHSYSVDVSEFDKEASWEYLKDGERFFLVKRHYQLTYFGPDDAVKFQEVSRTRAKLLLKILLQKGKYPLYTGEELHQKLILAGIRFDALTDLALEEISEAITADMIDTFDQDAMDPTTRDRIFMQEFINDVEEEVRDKADK